MHQVREVGAAAGWRTAAQRLSHWEFVRELLRKHGMLSPIFQVPWLTNEQFRIDWLHCSDQGVSADFLGNVFKVLLTKMEGGTKKARVSSLWRLVQQFYVANNVRDRLPTLTEKMIQQDTKPPKLRGSAGCVRALVPCALELAHAHLSAHDPVESAIRSGIHALNECYKCLSSRIWQADVLSANSKLFAQQYVALEFHATLGLTTDCKDWHVKPKLHMFLELCSEGSRPSMFWCYRDEDYGGTVAALSRNRGGHDGGHAMSTRVLELFKIKQPMIRIV